MGCSPLPEGRAVTEIDAIGIISGVAAVPIGTGGLGGTERAMILIIKGDEEQVKEAIYFVEQSKGAKLPQQRLVNFSSCQSMPCRGSSPKWLVHARPLIAVSVASTFLSDCLFRFGRLVIRLRTTI